MRPVALRTARLLLDAPTSADVDLITEYCNDDAFRGPSMVTPWPYERQDAVDFVTLSAEGWAAESEFTWGIRLDGALVGMVGYRTGARDIGFWLGAGYRGRGLVPEAVGGVLDWVFERDVPDVSWETTVGNLPSMAVARKAGFTYTGINIGHFTARDGTHPPTWQGILRATDSRAPKPGWPHA
ncbi:MAG TPA: GNAT family N-acetyltransferase [Galbitalea sp.]|jgi:RimJ/RimL family protein N-acetyltransferase|nr:GNAT family N-acetyltransferase [Galbitalea sp.]